MILIPSQAILFRVLVYLCAQVSNSDAIKRLFLPAAGSTIRRKVYVGASIKHLYANVEKPTVSLDK